MTKHNREDSQGYLERRKEGQLEHNWALLSLPKLDFCPMYAELKVLTT